MNREQLAHLLRAAAQIVEDGDILVLGSQAVLAARDADTLPAEVTLSVEADLAFLDDPDEAKADQVDGAIGEYSRFHDQHGFYAQGVSVATAVLPPGWRERLVRFDRPDALPSSAVCVEAHDLVVSKLVAGRDKDFTFAEALIREQLVDVETLLERADTIDKPEAVRERVRDSIRRCAKRASSG